MVYGRYRCSVVGVRIYEEYLLMGMEGGAKGLYALTISEWILVGSFIAHWSILRKMSIFNEKNVSDYIKILLFYFKWSLF